MAGLPSAPAADILELTELLHVGFFTVQTNVLELVKLRVCFLAEQHLILLGDGVAGSAQQVHAGHAVVAHSGVQGMIQRLRVHSDALEAVLDEPLAGVDAGADGVVIVSLGVVEQAVHTGVQAQNLALQGGGINAPLLAGLVQVLVGDQGPGSTSSFSTTASPV